MKFGRIFIPLVLAVFLISPVYVFAGGSGSGDPGGSTGGTGSGTPGPTTQGTGVLTNPINVNSIATFVKTLLEGLIKIGIPVIGIAIVYAGFLFVTARGNTEKLDKAKQALLYCLIGAALILGSWAIAQMISDTVLSL